MSDGNQVVSFTRRGWPEQKRSNGERLRGLRHTKECAEAVVVAALALMWGQCNVSAVNNVRDFAVLLNAETQVAPVQIRLNWPQDTAGTPSNYVVYRKSPEDLAWTPLATLPGSVTNFTDPNITLHTSYEYQVEKTAEGYSGYGYLLGGIECPLVEFRGTLVLIVDSAVSTALTAELARLEQDLVGDGWRVKRHDVSRSDSPPAVKALIQSDHAAEPDGVRSVLLFGHVPVPYSGDIVPDGHNPQHRGAWPADSYYGDMDGVWSDVSVNTTAANDSRNFNQPGDGKFDPSYIPSQMELEVGRVDFANLPAFSLNETELLRQYLNKDHNFRHKIITAKPRGLICDYFGTVNNSSFAASGWRNFAPFFGADQIESSSAWFSTLTNDSYLWAYGCGGGTYDSIGGIGTTADFARTDPQVVFTFLFGSYFGDWDTTNNVMRAALATPTYTLTSAWAGRPHWFAHSMALGETIGHATRLSQSNGSSGPYKQFTAGGQQIHIALMGDPTLRLHPVAPPVDLQVAPGYGEVTLTWAASAESVLGYFVYRAAGASREFSRITPGLVTATQFTDGELAIGDYTYMVRAVKLEESASGSYFNPSQGVFGSVAVTSAPFSFLKPTDIIVELGTAWNFITPATRNGCGEQPVTAVATWTNANCGKTFTATRVWKATHDCGNQTFCTNVVNLVDTKPPTLTCAASFQVTNGTPWTFAAPFASDLSGQTMIQVTTTITNATDGNGYVATRVWSCTDPCGNAATCSQTVTVLNSLRPILHLVATDASASESGPNTGMYTITRSGYMSSPVVVHLNVSGTARNGVDFVAIPTQLVIPAGESSATILLTPIADSQNEKTETATLTIQTSPSYVIGTSAASVSIANASVSTKGK